MDGASEPNALNGDGLKPEPDASQANESTEMLVDKELSADEEVQVAKRKGRRAKTRKSDILNWEKKYHIIAEVEATAKKFGAKSAIARKYGIARSTLSTLLNQKQKILALVEQGKNCGFRDKLPKFPKVDVALYEWFKGSKGDSGEVVSGLALKKKAEEFALMLGYENAQISKPWIARWKQRHGLSVRKSKRDGSITFEGSSGTQEAGDATTTTTVSANLRSFKPANVFYASEFGLCWRLLPENTTSFTENKCVVCKHLEERLTVLVGINITGTSKLDLLAIGTSANPITNQLMQIQYNQSGKLTTEIFAEYLQTLNAKMKLQGREITLHVNCQLENVDEMSLSHVKVHRQLPATPAEAHQISVDAAKHLKLLFRQRFLKTRLLAHLNGNPFSYNLTDALYDLSTSWSLVSQTAFDGLHSNTMQSYKQAVEAEVVRCQESYFWKKTIDTYNVPSSVSLSDYVNADDACIPEVIVLVENNSQDPLANNVANGPGPANEDVARAVGTLLRYLHCQQIQGKEQQMEGFFNVMDMINDALLKNGVQMPPQDATLDKSYTNCGHLAPAKENTTPGGAEPNP